jgi:hypothetical protein
VEGKALAIGRRGEALAPHTTQFEGVMIIHQDGMGRFQRLVAQEPRRDMLEHLHRDPDGTVAHRDDAQIGAMGNQGHQERGQEIGETGWRIAEGGAGLRKATPALHRHEQLFNANTRADASQSPGAVP